MNFGDFVGDVLEVALIDMPLSAIGGASAVLGRRGGSEGFATGLKIDALALAVGSGIAASGIANAGAANAATLGTEAATADVVTSGGAQAATATGAEAATVTGELAQGTLAGEAATAEAVGGEAATSGLSQFAGGAADVPGALNTNPSGGLINSVLGFTKEYPLASILGMGAVKGVADNQAAKEKAARDRRAALDLLEAKRLPAPSTGGVGVNMNIRPGDPILRRPDGRPVFNPGGLIASNMRR